MWKLVKVISNFFLTHPFIYEKFRLFFDGESVDEDIFNHILLYLLRIYTQMRAKDATWKMMAREKYITKLHIQQKMAALLDATTCTKSKSNERDFS